MNWNELLINAGVLLGVVGAAWRLIHELRKYVKDREAEVVASALDRQRLQTDVLYIKDQVSNHIPTQLSALDTRMDNLERGQAELRVDIEALKAR